MSAILANTADIGTGMVSAALAAKALDSTLGVPGAVIFKGVGRFSQLLLRSFGNKCLKAANKEESTIAKIVVRAFAFFGALAIMWKVLAVAGFAFSLKHLVVLNLATDFIQPYVVGAVESTVEAGKLIYALA